jgi:hypothetical protein
VLSNKLTAGKATEYAGSFIHNEDRWAKEVLESLSLTAIGRELAGSYKPLAADSQRQVDNRAPGLQGQAHHQDVPAVVGDNDNIEGTK